MTFLRMYEVDLNEYFMPRVQPTPRLHGPLWTAGWGLGATFGPLIASLLNGLPCSTLEPINGLGGVTSADGEGWEVSRLLPRLPDEGSCGTRTPSSLLG